VVLDGAMGSNLQMRPLDVKRDWLGHENASEILNFSRPDIIQEIHESFLAVGCDAVETNTFNASRNDLTECDMSDRAEEVNRTAAQIARRACDHFETSDRPRYVVGSVGPTRKLISIGGTHWDELLESFVPQMRGLLSGGADVILIETQQDLLAIKCAINAAKIAMKERGRTVPIMVQASFDTDAGQQMLAGSDVSALVAAIESYSEVISLGVNCAFGPFELTETVRSICASWPRIVSALPNAGLPIMDEKGRTSFPMTPPDFARGIKRMVEEFGVGIVGGCCGTTPEHLRMVVEAVGNKSPALRTISYKPQVSSLISATEIRQDKSYLIVAERTNTNGSRQFKRLLQAEDWDGLVSMARDEIREGSHLLDVCVDFVGRNGISDMTQIVRRCAILAPLMLDSTNPDVLEAGLKLAGGRCVLNSMNLEDGEERVAHICGLARKYGAAVVAGTIDEDKLNAMARTADRKISIAKRLRDLAVDKYGLRDGDIMFDPLVLPISTGIEEDRRNAMETIEGTRRISQQLPDCHTVVGLSNVSFGLKPAARVVLNSVFLHELREAGLTAAIVHASKILPRNRISDEMWNAALDLIHDRRREGFDPLTHFIGLFPDGTEVAAAAKVEENLSLEDKLKRHIIDGEMRDLIVHLDEALKTHSALKIINEILLEGMKVVGELFGSGQMQLPFVLQSAQTMKSSVAHLEKFMEKKEGSSKGRIVLATVKGDVHDIGKNLVDIILTNNGYTVFNLGIKQPVAEILAAAKLKKADAIGMSGLLVKSVVVMKENLEELNAQGINVPVLLGGAALTRDYAEETLAETYRGPLLYCRDAFEGLSAMDTIAAGKIDEAVATQRTRTQKRKRLREQSQKQYGDIIAGTAKDIEPIKQDNAVPNPPFWGRRVVTDLSPRHLYPYINRTALFVGQWGFRQKGISPDEYARLLADKAEPAFKELQRQAETDGILQPKIVYGYFPVQSEGDELIVYRPEDRPNDRKEWMRFGFPRQSGRRQLCISDFFRKKSSGEFDVLGVQLVTVGARATEAAEELRKADRYQEYLFLHGFSVESAEALAEMWHKRMRQELGFGSEDAADMAGMFQQGYRGSRYSFGYPACPNLEDRAKIVELLRPEEIDVVLSENFMLVPEQSTDAIVVHHPQAKYFDV